MRSSPAASRAWCLAVALACLAGQVHAEEQYVLLFDTETTPIVRVGPSALSPEELSLLPQVLGVGAAREDCATGVIHWLAPAIASRATGSFTRPGADEVLVSVRVRRCDDVELSPLPGALVVYEGSEALAHLWQRANVLAVHDVDLDGLLEVVLVTDQFDQGSLQRYATLWDFAGGEPRLVHDFGEVYADYCGSFLAYDTSVKHTRVTFAPSPGSPPAFEVATRSGSCRQ